LVSALSRSLCLAFFNTMGSSWTSTYAVSKDIDLSGKVAIVTGANTGIGLVTAKELARRKAHVILACRDQEKAKAAVDRLKQELDSESGSPGSWNVEVMSLDLASQKSVKQFASDFLAKSLPLNILVNNAGIMNTPKMYTEDGFEMQIGVNHLGHFTLTLLLLPALKNGAPSRVVNVSSSAHQWGHIDFNDMFWKTRSYGGWGAYGQSKLANILFTKELARRFQGNGITSYAVHPGFVATELARWSLPGFMMPVVSMIARTPDVGAQSQLYYACVPGVEKHNGDYIANCQPATSIPESHDVEVAKKLWTESEKLTGVALPQQP